MNPAYDDDVILTCAGDVPRTRAVLGVSHIARHVYGVLLAEARRPSSLLATEPTTAAAGWRDVSAFDVEIAARVGCHRRSVNNARHQLLAAGLVRVMRRGDGHRPTRYLVRLSSRRPASAPPSPAGDLSRGRPS